MIITRFHNREKLDLAVEFLTPTFLGGADQHAELRAAPFKNLFRQWWRISEGNRYQEWQDMLEKEGKLFGSVLNEKGAASQVRLLLTADSEDFAISDATIDLGSMHHPEVDRPSRIGKSLYLGFGPITYVRKQGVVWKKYIEPGSKAQLSITLPKTERQEFVKILHYIDGFGTIGSRSRNGWGSLALSGPQFEQQAPGSFPSLPIDELLGSGRQFPSVLGRDKTLLCWETEPKDNWREVMEILAETYLQTRTSINISGEGLQQRHALGYPITNHNIHDWGVNNGRMPSQLRLMVKKNGKDRYVGRILHLPHALPKKWDKSKLGHEIETWKKVHTLLDRSAHLHRSGGTR